jgi:hypothetical protein
VALQAAVPRHRQGALTVMSLASTANLDWKLCEEAVMRLHFTDQLKRKKYGKCFIYWGTAKLPPPVPVVVPQRLQPFMAPPWFRPRT